MALRIYDMKKPGIATIGVGITMKPSADMPDFYPWWPDRTL